MSKQDSSGTPGLPRLRTASWCSVSLLPFIALLGACEGADVDLGGNTVSQELESGSRCASSPIVDGSVFIENQRELDALAGCEEIRGDFGVGVFEGTDLRPLASLHRVTGTFSLGADASTPLNETGEAERARIVQAGWLASLQGVEGLEHVGALILRWVSAPDLTAFENLRYVADLDDNRLSQITVSELPHLVDLKGLENIVDVPSLFFNQNPALESLNGLHLAEVNTLQLSDDPSLVDLTALASLTGMNGILLIRRTALENLDALAGLSFAGTLLIQDNPKLTSADGLGNLTGVNVIEFRENPKLVSIPTFSQVAGYERYTVVANAALPSVTLSLALSDPGTEFLQGEPVPSGNAWIEITDNATLGEIVVANADTSARLLGIADNPSLTRVDLGPLQNLTAFILSGNASLSQVDLGDLKTVNRLSVSDNPLLSTAGLESVRTFESTFSGNAAPAGQ